jgi:replicative DNA helicase
MHLYEPEAEKIALRSLLDGDEEIRAFLLANVLPDFFGWPDSIECITRALTLIKEGKQLPPSEVFATDPVLSDDAKTFIVGAQDKPALESVDEVTTLVDTLKHYRTVRVAYGGAKDVISTIKSGNIEDSGKLIDGLESTILDARSAGNNTQMAVAGAGDTNLADTLVDQILAQDKDERIPTGFRNFDNIAGGFRRSNMVIIAGPTGGGKSTLAAQLCKNMYFDHHLSTCIVSFEMDESENVSRLLSNISQVPYHRIEMNNLTASQVNKVRQSWKDFKQVGEDHDCRFAVWCPNGELTAGRIVSFLKPMAFDVVVVDYIGLVGSDSDKVAQWESLGRSARTFKIAAKPLNTVMIVLAQFDSQKQVIRYARSLKEHANVMWTWNYGEDEKKPDAAVRINQEKNRNVKPFEFMLNFKFDTMTISDSDKNFHTRPDHPESTEVRDSSPGDMTFTDADFDDDI